MRERVVCSELESPQVTALEGRSRVAYEFSRICQSPARCAQPIPGLPESGGEGDGVLLLLPSVSSRNRRLTYFWNFPFPPDPMPAS